MSFPTTSILDNFNRADEDPLGNGTWSSGPDADLPLKLISGQIGNVAGGGNYWSASTFGPDCEIYVDLVTRGEEGNASALFVRTFNVNTPSLCGYRLRLFFLAAGDLFRLQRVDNDGFTQIGPDGVLSTNLVPGDGYGLEIIGSNITTYKRVGGVWSAVVTTSDATYPAAGYIAVENLSSNWVGDNVGGGTVVVVGPARPMFRGS